MYLEHLISYNCVQICIKNCCLKLWYLQMVLIIISYFIAQLAGVVEYTDCFSAEG